MVMEGSEGARRALVVEQLLGSTHEVLEVEDGRLGPAVGVSRMLTARELTRDKLTLLW